MCKPKEHVFISLGQRPPVVGTRCLCGLNRWGTAEQLRALDEIAALERAYALPAKEGRMSKGQHNSAHSHQWKGASSRGGRLKSKLGKGISLRRLEQLLAKKKARAS